MWRHRRERINNSGLGGGRGWRGWRGEGREGIVGDKATSPAKLDICWTMSNVFVVRKIYVTIVVLRIASPRSTVRMGVCGERGSRWVLLL